MTNVIPVGYILVAVTLFAAMLGGCVGSVGGGSSLKDGTGFW